jgi:dolichol-phosphate mannosyltransferase
MLESGPIAKPVWSPDCSSESLFMLQADSHLHPTTGGQKLLSIILPAFNEQEVLPHTYARFTAMAGALAEKGFTYELIFVNDGSVDQTADLLNGYAQQDEHVRAVHLTRNFGHQAAVTAGLSLAGGDLVAVMDCDLQDPPEILPQFIDKWREGFKVVYAIRGKRKEWLGKRLAYWSFYRMLSAISDLEIPLDSGDFCLMDRRAVDLLNSLPESQRFVRGLRTWVGLRQVGIVYERDHRHAGQPAYTFRALRRLAMDGLISFSSVPLRMVTRLGVLSGLGAVTLGIAVVIARLVHSSWFPPGWSSTACLILLATSVQLISLGVMGEYLARIFIEVKRRPSFLIAEVVAKMPVVQPEPQLPMASTLVEASEEKPAAPVVTHTAATAEVSAETASAPVFQFADDRRKVLVRGIRARTSPVRQEDDQKQS